MQWKRTLVSTLLFSLPLLTQAKPFEASGQGSSFAEARQQAIANAIKFSVGEYVTNKEQLNDEQLNQKIQVYSNAYVKRSVIKSQEQKGSEYYVTVEVDIEGQQIIGVIRSAQASSDSSIGQSLVENVERKIDAYKYNEAMAEIFGDLTEELLISPILEGKEIIVVEQSAKDLNFVKIDEDSGRLIFEYPVDISVNKDYVKTVRKLLNELKDTSEQKNKIEIRQIRLSGLDKASSVDTIPVGTKKLSAFYSALQKMPRNSQDPMKIILSDKNNNTIKTISYNHRGNGYNTEGFIIDRNYDISPILEKNIYPYLNNGKFYFFSGSISPKLIFSLTQDEYAEFKDNGKIIFE